MARMILSGLVALMILGLLAPAVMPAKAAADCSGIEAYIEQRRAVRDEFRADYTEALPELPKAWELSDDEWFSLVLSLAPEQLTALSELSAHYAEGLRNIQSPPVAVALHQQDTLAAQRLSNLLRDASTMGVLGAALLYGPVATPGPGELSLGDQLAKDCPAWGTFQAESDATPLPADAG